MEQPLCTTPDCQNPAINPSIGMDLCTDCNDAYQGPKLVGFWGLPWGWMSIGFWVAMLVKNLAMGQLSPSLATIILLGVLDVAAVVCLIFKVVKVSKARSKQ